MQSHRPGSPLTRSASEAKEVSVSEQSVEARVGLAPLAHETSQRDDVLLSGHLAVLIDLQLTRSNVNSQFQGANRIEPTQLGCDTYLGDLNLDRSVVLSGDESVGGRALSGDIEIHNLSFVVLHLYYS